MKYIIYHSADLDGYVSGAIVKKHNPDAILVGYDYGDDFNLELNKEDSIIIVDVSFKMPKFKEISDKVEGKILWIDHHILAHNEYMEYSNIHGKFLDLYIKIGISACELCWMYFESTEIPVSIKTIGDYDVYRKNDIEYWENVIMPYQMGMRSIISKPEDFDYNMLEFNHYNQTICDGKVILNYLKTIYKKQWKNIRIIENFAGLNKVATLNSSDHGSTLFDGWKHYDEMDAVLIYNYRNNHWKFSLYTKRDDVDCSKIAGSFGGGGHKKAAGFEVKHLNEILNFGYKSDIVELLEEFLKSNRDKIFMDKSGTTHTTNQILDELNNQSKIGINIINSFKKLIKESII